MSSTTARLGFQGGILSSLFGLALFFLSPSPGLSQIVLEGIPELIVHPEVQVAVSGDFDQDSHLDLFLGNDQEYVVLLGDGRGGFAAPLITPVSGLNPSGVACADFDLNGTLDVAIFQAMFFGLNRLIVLLGVGDGTFQTPIEMTGNALGPSSPVVADFNNDTIPDLASRDNSFIVIHLGDGTGHFASNPAVGGTPSGGNLVARDFDEDGFLDLALRNSEAVYLFFGDGTGALPRQSSHAAVGAPNVNRLVAGDFDEDGHVDLAAASTVNLELFLLLGRGDGTFEPRLRFHGQSIQDMTALDMDGDGHLDVVSVDSTGTATLLPGDGQSNFEVPRNFSVGRGPRALELGDFDEDGSNDLFCIDLDVQPGVLAGRLVFGADPRNLEAPRAASAGDIQGLTHGDFNGDGLLDMVSLENVPNRVIRRFTTLLRQPDGTYINLPYPMDLGSPPTSINTGDFDQDGDLDLALTTSIDVRTFMGVGDGTFTPGQTFAVGLNPMGLRVGRFDSDTHLDLLFLINDGAGATLLRNNGDGTFSIASTSPTEPRPTRLARGDFDGDGILDFVTGGGVVRFGNGLGTFPGMVDLGVSGVLEVGDVNSDGVRDIVIDDHVFLADGAGGFDEVGASGLPSASTPFVLAELSGDGRLDIAKVDGRTICLFEGDGTGRFTASGSPCILADDIADLDTPGDLDGDGLRDVVTWESNGLAVTILQNHTSLSRCLKGNVNDAAGPITDVLFVNGSVGRGTLRRVSVGRDEPFEIFMDRAPANQRSRFVLYGWADTPTVSSLTALPFGLGSSGLPTPLSGPAPGSLRAIWNNTGRPIAGNPTRNSDPAPSFLVQAPNGVGVQGTFFLQGVMADTGSSSPRNGSTTNGIVVTVR